MRNRRALIHSEGKMRFTRFTQLFSLLVFAFVLLACGRLLAGVTASISGTVTDSSGAVIAGATVTATNVDTGVATTLTTNTQGFYSFQVLALGKYTVDVSKSGFKAYRETDLVLDVNSALSVNVALLVGQTSEKVEVSVAAAGRDPDLFGDERSLIWVVHLGGICVAAGFREPERGRAIGKRNARGGQRIHLEWDQRAGDGILRRRRGSQSRFDFGIPDHH
jgi:hypothetical protein